ncbi:pentatricopeptide repeat-containing protein At1g08070, chloroplastic-like [Aristolochia californica]|uniref:pentatricopeptide repeat-containing protein At1g08070, chloroplastic-like n=1 Tax=Aristolochia californica TaxID=171875 RepID=UPI0035E13014
MYSKCGRIDLAYKLFEEIRDKDSVSWNTIISGFALHGFGDRALELFSLMQIKGMEPDDLTFIGVLSACSHSGLVQEGLHCFRTMEKRYKISPKLEHYGCIVDLLGRAELLKEAEEFIAEMPMKPNGAIWGALLSSCKAHRNIDLCEEAANELLLIEPGNDGVYVLLSNIFAGRKEWDKVRKVRRLMHERGIKKKPGCSSIMIDGVTHEFLVADRSHPESEQIHAVLDSVTRRLALEGYVAQTSEVLLNIDEKEKGDSISQHSEKLAICYGLIKMKPGKEIIIMKNLRICGDCHSAIKVISKVYQRKIIIRDRSRFHHFSEGSCSCKDYW